MKYIYEVLKDVTKILEYKDEKLNGHIRCHICGRILLAEYPTSGIKYHNICSTQCKGLFVFMDDGEEKTELIHALHKLRNEIRKQSFLDKCKKLYDSGDYETSDLAKHFSD